MGSRGKVFNLAENTGLLKHKLWKHNIEVILQSPSSIKKFATTKGNANKNVMLKETYKKWGVDFDNDNLCDAYGLARMAFEHYMGEKNESSRNERVDSKQG